LRKSFAVTILSVLLSIAAAAQSAPKPDWSPWNWIIGTWDGQGSGKPGAGVGSFSLLYSLDHAVLLRKNSSKYPATKTSSATHHDDLMVIYEEADKFRADYWDSERHVIHYAITMGEGTATFLSEKKPNTPTYRLVYKRLALGALSVEFSVAPPGSDQFKTYVTGTCHRRPGT
jgi:hypothetical protein